MGDEFTSISPFRYGGGFRLRYEVFDWPEHFDDGQRDRFRYRLRFGAKYEVFSNLDVGVELRSCNPQNAISDNQSFDDGPDKKQNSLAQAYMDWTVPDPFGLFVGKFAPNNLWTAADIEWDDDVVVEGAMQLFDWNVGGPVKALNLNLYQFVLNESGDAADVGLIGAQVGAGFNLGKKNAVSGGVTYETYDNPDSVVGLYFNGRLETDAEHVNDLVDPATKKLVSDFNIGNVLLECKNTSLENWPIKLTGYHFKDFGAKDAVGAILPVDGDLGVLAVANSADNDTGMFARLQVGDYKKPGQVQVRVTRYDSEPDAMFFAYSQSDSRRSSNVDGYRTDLRVGMPKKSFINVIWYQTDYAIGEDNTMNRFQFDHVFKFGASIPHQALRSPRCYGDSNRISRLAGGCPVAANSGCCHRNSTSAGWP